MNNELIKIEIEVNNEKLTIDQITNLLNSLSRIVESNNNFLLGSETAQRKARGLINKILDKINI